MNQNTIQCRSCGESISIDDVLTKQLEAKVIAKQQDKAKALAKQEAELAEQKEALSKEQEQFNANVKAQVAAQLGEERTKLMRDMRADAD